jgi:AcrR family transcriptional regulator
MSDRAPVIESRIERKKEETKQKIITAAITLFKQQGIEATTMEQIAAEADIAKGTLYNYFPVKEAILSEFIKRSFQQKNAERIQRLRALPDTRARLTAVLAELITGVQAQKEIFERFFTYQLQHILSLQKTERERSGIEELGKEIILLGQKSGEIRKDIPPGILDDLFDFVFIEVAKQFFMAPETFNPSQVIELCIDLFLNGVKEVGKS